MLVAGFLSTFGKVNTCDLAVDGWPHCSLFWLIVKHIHFGTLYIYYFPLTFFYSLHFIEYRHYTFFCFYVNLGFVTLPVCEGSRTLFICHSADFNRWRGRFDLSLFHILSNWVQQKFISITWLVKFSSILKISGETRQNDFWLYSR